MAYLEPRYIQNQKHTRNRGIFRTLAYSELWCIQNPVKHLRWKVFPKIVNGYNHFHNISFSNSLLYEKMLFFNTGLSCIPEVLIRCKVWGLRERGPATVNFWYNYLLMYSNKLAYLELITVLVYGSNPPKSQSYLNFYLNLNLWMNSFLEPATWIKKWVFSYVIIKDFFHRTPPYIFIVIINRFCRAFYYVNNMISH